MKKKVMSIVTDSTSLEDSKNPDTCNVFAISKLFMNSSELENLRDRYISGGSGYGHFKLELLEKIWNYFEPHREKREYYLAHIDEIYDILQYGATKAKEIANPIINRVREVTGINYVCI
jgi:tryptophanyl-tRNA synthetase